MNVCKRCGRPTRPAWYGRNGGYWRRCEGCSQDTRRCACLPLLSDDVADAVLRSATYTAGRRAVRGVPPTLEERRTAAVQAVQAALKRMRADGWVIERPTHRKARPT